MTKKEFINIVMQHTNFDAEEAERVTTAVLLTLRSQLSSGEALEIYDNLPEDIETLWESGWFQRFLSFLQGLRDLDRDEFIEQVREAADIRSFEEAEHVAEAVFIALKASIPEREVGHISDELPGDLHDFWDAA